jgi:hypothetical protein
MCARRLNTLGPPDRRPGRAYQDAASADYASRIRTRPIARRAADPELPARRDTIIVAHGPYIDTMRNRWRDSPEIVRLRTRHGHGGAA